MTLVVDVMIVNNIPILIAMSCSIKFVTVERTANQLRKNIKRIMELYSRGSIIVQTILMDL